MNQGATIRRKLFIKEYLIDFVGTRAAVRSGVPESKAAQTACRYLGEQLVQDAIAQEIQNRNVVCEMTGADVLQEFARIGSSDITDYLEYTSEKVTLIPSKDLNLNQTRAISKVVQRTNKDGSTVVSIEMHPKVLALKALAEHLGLNTQRLEVTGPDGRPIEFTAKPLADLSRLLGGIAARRGPHGIPGGIE